MKCGKTDQYKSSTMYTLMLNLQNDTKAYFSWVAKEHTRKKAIQVSNFVISSAALEQKHMKAMIKTL